LRLQAAAIFSDGMVLQREVPLRLWGTAPPQEELEARFRGAVYRFQSDAAGTWRLELPPQEAGGPFELVITGAGSELVIRDILIGDVWLLGGQSNMELPVARTLDLYAQEVKGADNPWIRQYRVPISFNFAGPQTDLSGGSWEAVNPQTVLEFSALGYFFAQAHNQRYRVPVGLVLTAVGGSRIEAWLSEEVIRELGGYEDVLARCQDPEYVRELTDGQLAATATWFEGINARDVGLQESETPWYSPDLDDGDWDGLTVPQLWKGTELEGLCGSVWLRKQFQLDQGAAGRGALLRLGAIADADFTYLNGVQVGKTGYRYPPRNYEVPPGVLKAGINTLAVRVIVGYGGGGFIEGKSYALEIGSERIDLTGEWKYKVGCRTEPLQRFTSVHHQPSGMYNAMIAPLKGCAFRGVLWYQGESNTGAPEEYGRLFAALVENWRRDLSGPQLPFLFVQLPNYDTTLEGDPQPGQWALLREQQLKSLELPRTAMAVTVDVGEANDLHPQNKKDIALRLHLAARRMVFGEPITAQGPFFARLERENGALRVYFTDTGGGLEARGGELRWFEVCGPDGVFHAAQAEVQGETVLVWSADVPEPVGVRYAWHDNPEGANLYSAEGLPASPFRAHL